jgi:hypothetical protein
VFGMGRDKNQRRHRGQGLQHARQRQAVGSGHVDIEQNHIKRLVLQLLHSLYGMGRLARYLHRRCLAVG